MRRASVGMTVCLPVLPGCHRRVPSEAVKTCEVSDPVSVCDLFNHPARFDGRIITVKGVYYAGLRDPSCSAVVSTLAGDWPRAVDLMDSKTAAAVGESAVRFSTDRPSCDSLDRVAIDEGKRGHRSEIWVTVLGLFRGSLDPLGTPRQLYGHLGQFPAEIVVEKICDKKTVDRPTYDYKLILSPHLRH